MQIYVVLVIIFFMISIVVVSIIILFFCRAATLCRESWMFYILLRLFIIGFLFLFCFNYSSTTECSNCDHKSVRHFCWWNKVSYNSYIWLPSFCVLYYVETLLILQLFLMNQFIKYVATPIQAVGNIGQGQRAMILLKHKLLKSILLRRTKKGRAADLALPPRIVSSVVIELKLRIKFLTS